MGNNKLDSRQTEYRALLAQLIPNATRQTLDLILSSIDQDLKTPLRIDATSTPSLVVNVGPSIVPNSVSNRNKSISLVGNNLPNFSGGTVTFPASSGGNITTSTGGSYPLTLASGYFCLVLLSLDSSGNLLAVSGPENAILANAQPPTPIANTLPFGYVQLQNVGGIVQNVSQTEIFQFSSSGGGSGGGGGGVAQSVAVGSGQTSITVTLATEQSSTNYVVLAQLSNTVDASVQYQPVEITNKTVSGFTVTWNGPTETSNYRLDYAIAPGLSQQAGEVLLTAGQTSVTITPPIALTDSNYVVVSGFVNITDSNPMLQPITTTAKSAGSFTVSWNAPLQDNNYRLSWQLASYQ